MEDFVIECKFTDKKSFRITLKTLEKLWNQALDANKEPILEIGIRRNDNEIFKIQGMVTVEKL
jgi:Holliday junction resolvase